MTHSWQAARRRISGSSRISSVRSRARGARARDHRAALRRRAERARDRGTDRAQPRQRPTDPVAVAAPPASRDRRGGGGLAALLTAAALDWVWEMSAIACAALLLGAVIGAGRERESDDDANGSPRRPGTTRSRRGRRLRGVPACRSLVPRAVLALLAVLALGAVRSRWLALSGAAAARDIRLDLEPGTSQDVNRPGAASRARAPRAVISGVWRRSAPPPARPRARPRALGPVAADQRLRRRRHAAAGRRCERARRRPARRAGACGPSAPPTASPCR